MHALTDPINRIKELEALLEQAERKSDILTNLLKEASAEFNQALEQVTASEANFRAIFENAPEAIYIIEPQSHQILDCNPFTLEWLGYSRAELLAMKVEEILEPGSKGVPENIQRALDEGRVHIQERRFCKKDGSIVDAEITGTLVQYEGQKAFVALVRDATERKQIEELSRYKELFANVSDPVFIIDPEGRFLEVNEVACSSFGHGRSDLLSKKLHDLVKPDQRQMLTDIGRRLETAAVLQFELDLLTKSGVAIPFEINANLIQYMGKAAVLNVARNLSLRKKMEETLVKTERLLAVGEMASGVAHNFNNLLQMIMGGGEAALAKLDAGKIRGGREAIQNILTACRRGSGIVRRIKDFTLSKSEQMDEARVFDIEELITEALELTRPLWKDMAAPRKYRVNVIKCTGCYVKGKPTEVYEVLVNLIKNALEAMPRGGTLTFTSQLKDGQVFVEIADTGYGIPVEDFQRIFEPFFTTKGAKSTGLGLSSSYGIIKKHRGDIHVTSRLGEGTTFTLLLPLAQPAAVVQDVQCEPAQFGKIRFLLIDDEVNILRSMEMFFEDSPVEILTAPTAREGLQAIVNDAFDVILCDFGMDDMNGLEVGKAVRKHCRQAGIPKIPFMLYTGIEKRLDQDTLQAAGVDRVVTKPIPCADLLRIIENVVAEQAGQRC